MTVRDSHYREKQPFRARGLRELDRLIGGVEAEIDALLARREPVRILELGCGYGTALLELAARYGRRVELHGLNRHAHDGDHAVLVRNATERGLVAEGAEDAFPWPALHFGDVARGLPFTERSFDLVYSQVAWLYFGNKLGVLQDVMRVLDDDGIAKIDADEIRPGLPAEYARLVEIWQDGRLVTFGDYLRRYGGDLVAAPHGEYARFGRCPRFGEDLERVLDVDLEQVDPNWDGVKCVYRVVR
jgi:SAM-dependent methyltransferase